LHFPSQASSQNHPSFLRDIVFQESLFLESIPFHNAAMNAKHRILRDKNDFAILGTTIRLSSRSAWTAHAFVIVGDKKT